MSKYIIILMLLLLLLFSQDFTPVADSHEIFNTQKAQTCANIKKTGSLLAEIFHNCTSGVFETIKKTLNYTELPAEFMVYDDTVSPAHEGRIWHGFHGIFSTVRTTSDMFSSTEKSDYECLGRCARESNCAFVQYLAAPKKRCIGIRNLEGSELREQKKWTWYFDSHIFFRVDADECNRTHAELTLRSWMFPDNTEPLPVYSLTTNVANNEGFKMASFSDWYHGNTCDQGDQCQNTVGSYSCACGAIAGRAGYNQDTCSDIDECGQHSTLCGETHNLGSCSNTEGSFVCLCEAGAKLPSCSNINECADNAENKCSGARVKCSDSIGSYDCRCQVGYEDTGSGNRSFLVCSDVDECERGRCHETCGRPYVRYCDNTDGSYDCMCDSPVQLVKAEDVSTEILVVVAIVSVILVACLVIIGVVYYRLILPRQRALDAERRRLEEEEADGGGERRMTLAYHHSLMSIAPTEMKVGKRGSVIPQGRGIILVGAPGQAQAPAPAPAPAAPKKGPVMVMPGGGEKVGSFNLNPDEKSTGEDAGSQGEGQPGDALSGRNHVQRESSVTIASKSSADIDEIWKNI